MSRLDRHNFVVPGEDIQKDDSEWKTAANLSKQALQQRWQTEEGRAKQERLRASRLERLELEKSIGCFNGHFDLRGIDLSDTDLSGQDLRDIDFFGANLSGCNFQQADLTNSFLSECDIRNARFDWANMEGVFLDNVQFDTRTSFHGVDLNRINFTLAALLHEQALSQQRIEHLKKRHPVLARFLALTSDYGRSVLRFLITCMLVMAFFAGIFWWFHDMPAAEAVKTSVQAFLGMTSPAGSLAYVAMLEAATGYFLLALLAAIMVRKTMGN